MDEYLVFWILMLFNLTVQNPVGQMLKWESKPENVLVIKKLLDSSFDDMFLDLLKWLVQEKHLKVFLECHIKEDKVLAASDEFIKISNNVVFFDGAIKNLEGLVDFVICTGGDGTLLYASSLFQKSMPPVMAFHVGSLGFLLPFEFSDFKENIENVLKGNNMGLILRTRLIALVCPVNSKIRGPWSLDRMEKQKHCLVLNEVVVDRGSTPYLCQLDLFIDDILVTVVQGDGLIISTPTGSTAYSAAAGASMVHPNVPAIIITPICPHSLSFRPIVVPAGVEIKIMVSPDARDAAWVSFDGRQRQHLDRNEVLIINTSSHPLPSIINIDPIADWFNRLAGCLHWNVRKHQLPLHQSPSNDSIIKSNSEARLMNNNHNCNGGPLLPSALEGDMSSLQTKFHKISVTDLNDNHST
ncbi:hypothetical protein HELRODRAFT_187858 [Helobdella robusta]|uniref:NAD(+) kinase n=1 Tax=Helobdella robusta TaxID=6412 RepID=T1FPF7_HELRO|nr:hypothetical protein HELRODRAFT_187858 [Helobdella robusta]ESO12411.1 hypothetical protein HELRODRAFT_187858 [Helobdella robusta]